MLIKHHWLQNAEKILSPNHDERPDIDDISLIVIHCISLPPGEFESPHIEQLFTNQLNPEDHPYFAEIHQLQVSCHVLINRAGKITQFVPFDKRAWHAGQSEYCGRSRCNDFSIGIELEGTEATDYTEIQYLQLGKLITSLIQNYPKLNKQSITGHCDIAPGRKTDPGNSFDWLKLEGLLSSSV